MPTIPTRSADKETEEDLLHLLVLAHGPLRDHQDSRSENTKSRKCGLRLEVAVCLGSTDNFRTPLLAVVKEHAFVQLVHDVGCDAAEDVAVWGISPEWCVDRADSVLLEMMWCGLVPVKVQGLECPVVVAPKRMHHLPTLILGHNAARAATLLAARNQALLGVVGDVCREDGEEEPRDTAWVLHLDAFLASLGHWLKQGMHALMK
jgi:hypothetical protein